MAQQAPREAGSRERIHRIAAELFARNGYDATGIAELSEAVGLGRGGLYHHIDSKQGVLEAICRGAIERLLAAAGPIAGGDAPAEEQLRALARGLLRDIADHRAEWTVFFREINALSGAGRAAILREREAYEALWTAVLARGAADGALTAVSPLAIKGILGMFNYSYLWLDPAGDRAAEEIAEEFCALLLRGLRR